MTGVFDVAQALDGGITDQERAWVFVRAFAAAWDEPLTEDDGTPAAELARAEATLGCSLPAVLCEFYTLLGTQSGLIANQDPLLPAPRPACPIPQEPADGMVRVVATREPGQGLLSAADPPVCPAAGRLDHLSREQQHWRRLRGSAVGQAHRGSGHRSHGRV